MAIASGYYAHSVITAVWALILGVVCLLRIRRALHVMTTMFFRVTPGVLLYCILVIVEAVDFEGLYGIYDSETPAAIRIVETDDLACCSFGAMHLILTIAYSLDRKKVPSYVGWVFVTAAAFKFLIGLATAIAYPLIQQKRVMIPNDIALLITFCVSIGIMIRMVYQVQFFLASHLERVPSVVLSQSLVKMRRILMIAIVAALAVPGFLVYNVIDHWMGGTSISKAPNPAVYRLGYSVWFKLVWASFLLWLSRPTHEDTQTEVDSKGFSRTKTKRAITIDKQDSSHSKKSSNRELSQEMSERPELDKQNSLGSVSAGMAPQTSDESGRGGRFSQSPVDEHRGDRIQLT